MSTETAFLPAQFPALRGASADIVIAQAKAHGHAAGYAEGLRSAAVELERLRAEHRAEQERAHREHRLRAEQAVAVLATAAHALETRLVRSVADVQDALSGAAIDLAEAILGYELRDEENSAKGVLRRVLGQVEAHSVTALRMNPDDLELIDDETRAECGMPLVADSTLSRGDALAQLPDGYLDARIGAALTRARTALLGAAS